MNREEAINSLANFKRYISGGGVVDRKANEAINMAIEALKAQENMIPLDGEDIMFVTKGEYEALKAHEWIPVSDRLPDTNDKVLVTMIENEYGDTKVYFGSYTKSVQLWTVEDRASYFTHVEVTAWMPIPEPWKEKS